MNWMVPIQQRFVGRGGRDEGGKGEEELSSVKNRARNCDPMAMRIRIAKAVAIVMGRVKLNQTCDVRRGRDV
jgi:hypothetical protein